MWNRDVEPHRVRHKRPCCVTSIHHSITIQPQRVAIPNPAAERTRDSAGEGSAPLPLQVSTTLLRSCHAERSATKWHRLSAYNSAQPKHPENVLRNKYASRRSHETVWRELPESSSQWDTVADRRPSKSCRQPCVQMKFLVAADRRTMKRGPSANQQSSGNSSSKSCSR
jgi:hypothetical protein